MVDNVNYVGKPRITWTLIYNYGSPCMPMEALTLPTSSLSFSTMIQPKSLGKKRVDSSLLKVLARWWGPAFTLFVFSQPSLSTEMLNKNVGGALTPSG